MTGTNILVKRDEAEDKSQGGIFLPDISKDKPLQGTIVNTGKDIGMKEGDRVLFDFFAGVETTLEGEKYLIMDANDVLLIFE